MGARRQRFPRPLGARLLTPTLLLAVLWMGILSVGLLVLVVSGHLWPGIGVPLLIGTSAVFVLLVWLIWRRLSGREPARADQ